MHIYFGQTGGMKKYENIDHKLLLRLKEGDKQAFDAVYWRYSPKAYNVALYMLGDTEVAEDVVQELFLTIWEKRSQIQPHLNFEAYLLTIARHIVYHYIESAVHRNLSVDEFPESELPSVSGEEVVDAASLREYIDLVIDTFPKMRKKVFIMSRIENRSNAEIAAKLSISERTVEAHIYQALKTFHKLLADKTLFCLVFLSVWNRFVQ